MLRSWRPWLVVACSALLLLVVTTVALLVRGWQERTAVTDIGWPVATPAADAGGSVTVTWLGITTLLFDDGETQILTDGTFSRPDIMDIITQRPVWSDMDTINYALARFRMDRLAAIIPLHSHYDHAMDAGHVANRTSAVVLGSESTANIARGADVPVNQYQILASGETRQFGNFTITLVASRHAPIGLGGTLPFAGNIEAPLRQPARISEWREGGTWSVLISHPEGTALIQGSGGYVENGLAAMSADVVMLGVAGLAGLGREYVSGYWNETVSRTGARQVYPVHFEDFTQPFGEIALFPDFVDELAVTADWINELAAAGESPVHVARLPFGQPLAIFHQAVREESAH
ncbi:MAG: hypothetical protein WD448_13295 [Woeseia sp.]